MTFDPSAYGPRVAQLLALDGAGHRLMPLTAGRCCSPEAAALLRVGHADDWFPHSRSPRGAMAGLWLYFSALDEAHLIAQDLATAEGSFWHAIVHRLEPDAWNSGYWFRRLGEHVTFFEIKQEAKSLGGQWGPLTFIEYCDEVRSAPESPEYELAMQIQRAEWQILFDYCAGKD